MNRRRHGAQPDHHPCHRSRGQFSSPPDGKKLVFTSDVFPYCGADDACNRTRLDAVKNSKVKARTYTDLLYRHWTDWQRRTALPSDGRRCRGWARQRSHPRQSRRSALLARRSRRLRYFARFDPRSATPSITTPSSPPAPTRDLYVVPINGGEPKRITTNPGADSGPQYSPDGKYIAYRSQARAGYESDRWQLMLYDRAAAASRPLTETLDRWVASFAWSPDSTRLLFTTEDRGRQGIHMIPVQGRRQPRPRQRQHDSRRHAAQPRRQGHDLHRTERFASHRDLSRDLRRRIARRSSRISTTICLPATP